MLSRNRVWTNLLACWSASLKPMPARRARLAVSHLHRRRQKPCADPLRFSRTATYVFVYLTRKYYDPQTLGPDYLRPRPRRQLPPLLGPTKRDAMKKDPIHILGLNPAKPSLADDSYKNGAILQQFVTEMGRMQPRNITGLTRKSQRQVGKALRRAHAMGILPVLARGQGRSGGGWR